MSPDLATALREETPNAPVELRERVTRIAATPPPLPRRTLSLRRVLVVAAPVTVAASLALALAVGIKTAAVPSKPATGAKVANLERQFRATDQARTLAPAPQRSAAVPAPSGRRAQNVQANLRILVDDTGDLSAATQRALRTTSRLGGYVLAVDYGTPEATEGTATLRVRIPVSRVQAAIVEFSGLGRILAQQTQITDVQQQLDELTRQIRQAKGGKARIAALRRQRTALSRRAAYATVAVDLTTYQPQKKAASPGRLDRAVEDATGILAAELAIAAYALIVASPFLVLLLAGLAGNRAYRRYADQRLLERA